MSVKRAEKRPYPSLVVASIRLAVEQLIARHANKSLREIAEIVGIPQPMLSSWRHGRSLGLHMLLDLHRATGWSTDRILFGENAVTPSEIVGQEYVAQLAREGARVAADTPPTEPPAPRKPSDAPRPRRR